MGYDPATAEALSKLKIQTGSNQTLLQFVDDGLVVAGLPVFVSPKVDALTLAWGIPKERVVTVLRKGTEVVGPRTRLLQRRRRHPGDCPCWVRFPAACSVVRLYDAA